MRLGRSLGLEGHLLLKVTLGIGKLAFQVSCRPLLVMHRPGEDCRSSWRVRPHRLTGFEPRQLLEAGKATSVEDGKGRVEVSAGANSTGAAAVQSMPRQVLLTTRACRETANLA